jgi:hypothetical protein
MYRIATIIDENEIPHFIVYDKITQQEVATFDTYSEAMDYITNSN